MTKQERDSVAAWQAHFDFNHVPFRHDCSVCLETAGRDRHRKALECKTSFCLSVDVAGPFQAGEDQASGPAPRYMLVANLTVPVNAQGPMVQGLKDLGFKLQPPSMPSSVTGELDPGEEVANQGDQDEDPMEVQPGDQEEEVEEVEVVPNDEQEQRWREFIKDTPAAESHILTFALPLVSRKTQHVLPVLSSIFARIGSMQVPILRVHTDRAQEFQGNAFRKWCQDRSLWHTMSPGDEPTQNSRVERTIGTLKARVRTLIRSTKAPITWWPYALRQAAESMLRAQLWTMGIFTPKLPSFGARAVAKSKTWHQRSTPWKFPGTQVRIWGPAHDMSITSGGVIACSRLGR